ncbi:MAG TPA: M55 family metallopeptidase [Candidatus Obscuribacterales bacterium]
MRAYLSVDLEGINGIVHSSQTQPGEPGYERAVGLMHDECNAVIEGLIDGGVEEILVNDAHWDARNLRIEKLHPKATLISGWQKPYSMMSGVQAENKPGFAIFLGYHCRSGTAGGVLSHTYRAQVFRDVLLNGRIVGETALNAALAGWFGVPVAMVTGDSMLREEVQSDLPGVMFIVVKDAISRYAAHMRPQENVLAALKYGSSQAARSPGGWRILKPPTPSTMRIAMVDTSMADGAELVPGVRRVSDREIEFTDNDFSSLFRTMLAVGAVGASRRDPYFS